MHGQTSPAARPHQGLEVHPAGTSGLTVVELVAGLALLLVLGSLMLPGLVAFQDRAAGLAAARQMAGQLAAARLAALESGRVCGLLVVERDEALHITPVRDGNGNGLRLDEVARGIDTRMASPAVIGGPAAAARPGIAIDGPDVDGDAAIRPTDPALRLGPSGVVSFSPAGTGSSGTIYLRTRQGRQFAVRLLGATGRLRAYEYLSGERRWATR